MTMTADNRKHYNPDHWEETAQDFQELESLRAQKDFMLNPSLITIHDAKWNDTDKTFDVDFSYEGEDLSIRFGSTLIKQVPANLLYKYQEEDHYEVEEECKTTFITQYHHICSDLLGTDEQVKHLLVQNLTVNLLSKLNGRVLR